MTVELRDTLKGERMDDFLYKCSTDFSFFCERVLNLQIKPFHLEWVESFYGNLRSCVLAFRGSGKTTILGAAFPLWLTLFDENEREMRSDKSPMRFLIISSTLRESTKIIAEIRSYINQVQFISHLKPDDRDASWTKTQIETSNGCKLLAKPYSLNVKGDHVHYLLCDEGSRYEDPLIFKRAVLPMVNWHDGHLMVSGTIERETDLVYQLSRPESKYWHKDYPVMRDGNPLWPEKFSIEKINTIKDRGDMSAVDFAREYLCKIVIDEIAPIPRQKIAESMITNLTMENNGDKDSVYYLGIDLALSPVGNFSVATVIKTKPNDSEDITVAYMYRKQGEIKASQIKLICGKFNIIGILIDELPYGKPLVAELGMNYGIQASTFKFESRNRLETLYRLTKLWSNGNIKVPYDENDPYTQTHSGQLIKEISGMISSRTPTNMETYDFTTQYSDCVMSLALACQMTSVNQNPEPYIAAW